MVASKSFERNTDRPEIERAVNLFISENLPETEERISEPMDPACEVSVVIPVYGERDYILRALKSLAEQEDVTAKQYEVILVVNNSSEKPPRELDETEEEHLLRLEQYEKALEENQDVIKLVRCIKEQPTELPLNEDEQAIVDAITKRDLKLHIIDKATGEKALSPTEANVGGARNRGLVEAVERFYKQLGKNGIIAHSDADVRFDEKYIKSIIEVFQRDPALVAIAGELVFERIEDEKYLFDSEVSFYEELRSIYEHIAVVSMDRKENQSTYEEYSPPGDRKEKIWFSGGNMASRAFEAALAGGIPKLNTAEDTRFGFGLTRIGKTADAKKVLVFPADRFSVRAAGHGMQKMKAAKEIKSGVPVESPEVMVFWRDAKKKFYLALKEQKVSADVLGSIFTFHDTPLLKPEELREIETRLTGVTEIGDLEADPSFREMSEKLKSRVEAISPRKPLEEACSLLIGSLSQDPSLKDKYVTIYRERLEEERVKIIKNINIIDKLVDVVLRDPRDFPNIDAFFDFVEAHKSELGIDDGYIRGLRELEGERRMGLDSLRRILRRPTVKQEMLGKITGLFKNQLTKPEDNPLYLKFLSLQVIDGLLIEKHQH